MDGLRMFNVGLQDKERIVYAVEASRLMERKAMDELLQAYTPLMKALVPVAAGTYFCTQLAGFCLALQYSLSCLGKSFDSSLDNITVQLYAQDDKYGVAFKLTRSGGTFAPADPAVRETWLYEKLASLYGETIRPLYESVAASVNVDAGQMWGVLPTRFNYSTEQWLLAAQSEREKENISGDYALLRSMPADVFGRNKSPFDVKIRWIEDLKDPCKQMRMKNVCCQYYQTEGGYYCFTCPRLKESEREERRKQARLAAAAAT
ncbi:(2Fe-2S)-binding protein [Paenibacillus hodogayensis]|uniref:(2Fe-2S)-binding protein n=1 Tax=Paenibacillus hodogayensis TaxID=279208 RepID=A0ABV5VVV1_9BACL